MLRKSSPASNNQIPQASLPVRAGALFSCRLSSFWKSAGLQNHRPLVRIRPPSLREGYYKTETPVPGSDTGVLGEHGWITQAALLKTAHWAVFALSSATAPQLFESTLAVLCRSSNKTETPASSQRWSSWWSEATQIRTIALWGIFGGNFIESDGFCAIFVVECNQNFFIIEINRIHECIDKHFPVAFHVRVELAKPGQPEPNLIFA